MENDNMKKCPYCAEQIRAEAIKCRYCGSDLTKKSINLDFLKAPGYWHRVNEGKKIGGVCVGISQQLESPVLIMPLRLFFIITTLFWGFGLLLYIILWLLMPPPTKTTAGPTQHGNSPHYGKTEKPASGASNDIQTEKSDADIETGQPESAVETKEPGTENETKESDGDIITIGDMETVEDSHDANPQGGEKSEQFEKLPEITDDNEKSGKETTSERRKMTPLLGIGLIAVGVFASLRIYMGIIAGFMGFAIPTAFVVFGVIAVASIMAGAMIKLPADRNVEIVV